MGAEDFVVRLSSGSTPPDVTKVLLAIPQVHPDATFPSMRGESHFRYEDPEHIIEIELAEAGPRTTVSLRFAVCHPTSIDDVFTTLVVDLVNALSADIVIAEDVEPDDPGLGWSFSPSQLTDLRKSLLQCIPKKRSLWQTEFGRAEARVSCKEAIDRFVIGSSTQGP